MRGVADQGETRRHVAAGVLRAEAARRRPGCRGEAARARLRSRDRGGASSVASGPSRLAGARLPPRPRPMSRRNDPARRGSSASGPAGRSRSRTTSPCGRSWRPREPEPPGRSACASSMRARSRTLGAASVGADQQLRGTLPPSTRVGVIRAPTPAPRRRRPRQASGPACVAKPWSRPAQQGRLDAPGERLAAAPPRRRRRGSRP